MKFLKTQYSALIGIIFILMATLKHSYEVYVSITAPPEDIWMKAYIIAMMLSIDFAVLLFTIHGNQRAAGTFAFLIGIINLYALWSGKPIPGDDFSSWIHFLPGLIYASMLAYGLYYFTDVFVGEMENDIEKKGLIKEKDRWEKLAKSLQKKQGAPFRKGSAKSAEEKVKAAYAYFSERNVIPTREQVAEKAKVSVPTVRKYSSVAAIEVNSAKLY